MKSAPSSRLRTYQEADAAAILKNGNTLLVKDTGTGKTLTALAVAGEILRRNPEAQVLFSAPTGVLVDQHRDYTLAQMEAEPDEVVVAAGKDRQSLYTSPRAKIIFATPETLAYDLRIINWQRVRLVVLDESHEVVGNDASAQVARAIKPHQPLRLALTASPGKRMEEIIDDLEIKQIIIREATDPEVAPYVFHLRRAWQDFELPPPMKELRQKLESMADKCRVFLEDHGILEKDPQPLLYQELRQEQWQEGFPQRSQLLPLYETLTNERKQLQQRLKELSPESQGAREDRQRESAINAAFNQVTMLISAWHMIDLLESHGVGTLRSHLRDLLEAAGDEKRLKDYSPGVRYLIRNWPLQKMTVACDQLLADNIDHPKLEFLKAKCQEWVKAGKFVLIFSHYRHSVLNIVEVLKGLGITAQGIMGAQSGGMPRKQQRQMINDFREHRFQVLVSTALLHLGIHLADVDIGAAYDGHINDIEMIQREGRVARVRDGEFWCLFTKGNCLDSAYYYSARRKKAINRAKLRQLKDQLGLSQAEGLAANSAQPDEG